MMISFKPSGYSREEMISAVEAMGYPYAFSGLKRRELEDFFCQVVGRSYALAVRDLIKLSLLRVVFVYVIHAILLKIFSHIPKDGYHLIVVSRDV